MLYLGILSLGLVLAGVIGFVDEKLTDYGINKIKGEN